MTRLYIDVFPAYAGMSRGRHRSDDLPGGFPRLRGDEPERDAASGVPMKFSPPTRG